MAILKASAQNGASRSGGRVSLSFVLGLNPLTGGTSFGDGSPAKHGHRLGRNRVLPDRLFELVCGQLLSLQKLLCDPVVEVGELLDHLLSCDLRLLEQSAFDRPLLRGLELLPARPVKRPHTDEIHHAFEVVFGADGDLYRDGVCAQPLPDLLDNVVERGADSIQLVYEGEPGHAKLGGLEPHRLGLRLDAPAAAKHDHRRVEHSQAPLHLHGEVHVSGRVYQMDVVFPPVERRRSRRDGDAPVLLLDHPIHLSLAVVHLSHPVNAACVVEEPLCYRGLSSVDVSDDSDVSYAIYLCHCDTSPSSQARANHRASRL
jgi:hypothetical protein